MKINRADLSKISGRGLPFEYSHHGGATWITLPYNFVSLGDKFRWPRNSLLADTLGGSQLASNVADSPPFAFVKLWPNRRYDFRKPTPGGI